MVRTPACHAGGRGFKSLPSRHLLSFEKLASYLLALLKERNASVAQLVEQRTENPRVAGSIPALGIFVAKSNEIIEYGRVAQLVEHLTFNQVVRGSNPRTLIVEQAVLLVLFFPKLYMRMWRNWQTRWF